MKTNTLSLLFIPLLSYFSLSQTAQADNPEIARLRDRVIELDARLITNMSQAETGIGNDVELVHASILAAQLETVDTEAAYREAKSLIADLDVLRRHAIADLTLPSDYTPPDVPPPTALAGSSTDPESELALSYREGASVQHLFAAIAAATLDVQRKLQSLLANGGEISITEMFELQMLMNHFSQLSEMTTSLVGATNTAILSMARNVKS
jgi:hypothetical protein